MVKGGKGLVVVSKRGDEATKATKASSEGKEDLKFLAILYILLLRKENPSARTQQLRTTVHHNVT